MGRKIPGRKHHGVRDPDKQRAERVKKLKDKINAPPTNPDDQEVPKSLQRIVDLKNKARTGQFKRKRRKKSRDQNVFPGGFQQLVNESDKHFLSRVNDAVAVVQHEAAFEQKFNVQVKRNKDGEIESVEKRPKDPVQIMMKEARQEKKKKGKQEGRLTKSQKRQLKLGEKKKKRLEDKVDEFDKFQDRVKFGEQVHAPPSLTVPRRTAKVDTAPRPGQKDLLLKSMLNLKKTGNKTIDKKGKRKELPNALRRQLDQQQQEVIQAYRLLKGKKRETA